MNTIYFIWVQEINFSKTLSVLTRNLLEELFKIETY